jgi:hypothetical protein
LFAIAQGGVEYDQFICGHAELLEKMVECRP